MPDKPSDPTPAPTPARQPITQQRLVELIRQMESKSDAPVEFTPEHAEALRMNAELASKKWLQTRVGCHQMNLSRWRALPQAPEVEAVLRNALQQHPVLDQGGHRIHPAGMPLRRCSSPQSPSRGPPWMARLLNDVARAARSASRLSCTSLRGRVTAAS